MTGFASEFFTSSRAEARPDSKTTLTGEIVSVAALAPAAQRALTESKAMEDQAPRFISICERDEDSIGVGRAVAEREGQSGGDPAVNGYDLGA